MKILNEPYLKKKKIIFNKGIGNYLYHNGKKYFDLSSCNGVSLLGHNHKIFKNSLDSVFKKKLALSPEKNDNALKLSNYIKFFFPKFNNIIFCNSGSEAVIKSLRIAKSLTPNKTKILCVTGSWHGSVDQTLFYPDKKLSPKYLSKGVDENHKKNIIFIPYNDIDNSIKIIKKNIKKISCLIIEPITASLPSEESIKYLKKILEFCKRKKIIVIFDEIITGFRSQEWSVQRKNNFNPDITLLGKVIGGGSPIGIIGINRVTAKKIKDKKIFFGGTFSANNFTTHLGLSVAKYLKKNKKIVNQLINKCRNIQEQINLFIEQHDIDAKVYRYDSILRLVFSRKKAKNRYQRDFFESKIKKNKNFFIKYLFKNKVYYPPNGVILLPITVKDKEIKRIINILNSGLYKFFKK